MARPRIVSLGFQLAKASWGCRETYSTTRPTTAPVPRRTTSPDFLRQHGPFEPHRLPLDEMEYTTMPAVAAKMAKRWQSMTAGEAASSSKTKRAKK